MIVVPVAPAATEEQAVSDSFPKKCFFFSFVSQFLQQHNEGFQFRGWVLRHIKATNQYFTFLFQIRVRETVHIIGHGGYLPTSLWLRSETFYHQQNSFCSCVLFFSEFLCSSRFYMNNSFSLVSTYQRLLQTKYCLDVFIHC
jgi:hypothetical protein